ncbi:myocyte-specific enhancer factor 2B [Protopterus annectens]|uniref:myocyte-specific enhancer factor 2B n=1 Tax=Protopterus annectens TaxID=7888 RepID=UPI001CF94553|nr:myocyte-specific enhancer factor 2B [Protopterus annectens]XP_043909857.1 myocyte-specific enhancer factor 2B [Protopterus annectens]XP_043909858.1 myocyte-specific enhancer factor 2B [Protopterus annectens]XP_043909859.1 myocyte-specific enhancer factor 2B [Protopterus annectens]
MGRKKIQISRILDQRNRQVTFTKRKFGLMKKAYELSVLCDCEIALIIFNSTNRLFQYASTDMDKVLLKYTEYSEPHESRTNSDILETLRRKGLGLGLDSSDLEIDESTEPAEKFRKLSEGVDLSSGRQRLYAAVSNHESPYSTSSQSETGGNNMSGTMLPQNRSASFKSLVPKHGLSLGRSPGPAHSGTGYSLTSHSNLNKTTKTPPPLNLGTDTRRCDLTNSFPNSRSSPASVRTMYPGLQPGNPVVPVANTTLQGHALGGFPYPPPGPPEYPHLDISSHPGFVHAGGLQQSPVTTWQHHHHHHHDMPPSPHSHIRVPNSMLPATPETTTAPPPSQQTISIKAERISPGMNCASSIPQHHLTRHSPLSDMSRASVDLNQREDYPKGYNCPLLLARPLTEDRSNVRRSQLSDSWQR